MDKCHKHRDIRPITSGGQGDINSHIPIFQYWTQFQSYLQVQPLYTYKIFFRYKIYISTTMVLHLLNKHQLVHRSDVLVVGHQKQNYFFYLRNYFFLSIFQISKYFSISYLNSQYLQYF